MPQEEMSHRPLRLTSEPSDGECQRGTGEPLQHQTPPAGPRYPKSSEGCPPRRQIKRNNGRENRGRDWESEKIRGAEWGQGLRAGQGAQRVRSVGEGQKTDPEHRRQDERPDQGNEEMPRGGERCAEWLPPTAASWALRWPLLSLTSYLLTPGAGGEGKGGQDQAPLEGESWEPVSLSLPTGPFWVGHPDPWLHPEEKAGRGGRLTLQRGAGLTAPPAPNHPPQVLERVCLKHTGGHLSGGRWELPQQRTEALLGEEAG